MTTYRLKFTTESDATFGRGDGLASLIDAEFNMTDTAFLFWVDAH